MRMQTGLLCFVVMLIGGCGSPSTANVTPNESTDQPTKPNELAHVTLCLPGMNQKLQIL